MCVVLGRRGVCAVLGRAWCVCCFWVAWCVCVVLGSAWCVCVVLPVTLVCALSEPSQKYRTILCWQAEWSPVCVSVLCVAVVRVKACG